jgi:hypothetical protein
MHGFMNLMFINTKQVKVIHVYKNTRHKLYRTITAGVSTHSRHQPAATWVNTTRYSKYSEVLLMMGKKVARKM